VALAFAPRPVAPELAGHYRAEGLWDDSTLGAVVARGLQDHPGSRIRIWSRDRPYDGTFGDVADVARRLAGGLRAAGIEPGDVVSFQLPNWMEAAAAFYAGALTGAVLVPIVHIYGARELAYILRQAAPRAHVATPRFGHLDYAEIIDGLRADVPSLEQIVFVGDDVPSWGTPWSSLAEAPPVAGPAPIDPDAPCVLGYTSGTTADPKGVVHTHRTLLAEVRQLTYDAPPSIAPLQAPPGNRPVLLASPVSHATGMLGGLLSPVVTGSPINLLDRWDPAHALAAMLDGDLTGGGGATYFLTSLLDHPNLTSRHLEHMRYVALGGAPIPPAVAERADSLGISLVRAYGSTEHPSVTGSAHADSRDRRLYTDGRPMPGVEVRIASPDGHDLGPGEPGEITTRGPDLFVGYTDAALTAARLDTDGWYATGDIGILDEQGYLTVTDRTADLIIRGGENVSAAEVEAVLAAMAGVAEVAVVAAPDARLGEHGCAFIRPMPGVSTPDLEAIRGYLRLSGLARQKWPEEVRGVDEFDRTPSGKVKKFVLRARLRDEAPPPQARP